MSDLLRPRGPKKNHRKGIAAARKAEKRVKAETMQLSYSKLTIDEKIAKLDAGGYAAKKQRARLEKLKNG